MSKLVLGTAQFGLTYGINNKKGKTDKQEIFKILEYAKNHDIDTLDTAYGYGSSEEVIGFYKSFGFKIISKLPEADLADIENIFFQSLKRLNTDKLYGYLIHDFSFFKKNPEVWQVLQGFKKKEKIEKIGFSLYYPIDLEYLLDSKIEFDIIQLPYSIFDQRFSQYFKILNGKKIEIHVRSVFLQGLVFKKLDYFKRHFLKLGQRVKHTYMLAKRLNVPLSAVYLNFAAANPLIDKIVIGVDGVENLQENVTDLKFVDIIKDYIRELEKLKEDDERIIVPSNWSRQKRL